MKLRTELALIALVFALVVGLCFSCKAQQVCRPGMPCYQGGQTYQAPQAPQSRPATFCDLLVKVQDNNGMSIGSGTPVQKHKGKTVVLTNWHVVRERASDTSVTVYRPNSPPAAATVLEADEDIDVAVLLVDADWPVVNLGTDVDTNAALQTRGFAHGTSFRVYQGRIKSRIARGYFLSSPSISGMSGGGVFQNNQYVGIIWGGADSYCAITSVRHIRPFLNRVLGRQVIEVQTDLVPIEAPPQEPNTPPDRCPNCPGACDCDARINKLIDLQAELVLQQQSSVEQQGAILDQQDRLIAIAADFKARIEALEKLPIGRDGKDGLDGKDADTTALELRINQLESQLADIRATTPVSWDIVPKED